MENVHFDLLKPISKFQSAKSPNLWQKNTLASCSSSIMMDMYVINYVPSKIYKTEHINIAIHRNTERKYGIMHLFQTNLLTEI